MRDQAGTNLWGLSLSALWFCQASHIPGLTEDVTGRPRYPPSSPRDDRVIQVTHIPPGDTKLALSSYGNLMLALGLGTPAPCNSFPPGGPRGSSQVCMGEGCFAVCHRQWFENYSKKKLLQREERERRERNIERNQKAYKIDSTFFVINFNGHEITLSIFHKHFQMLTLYLFSLLTTSFNKQFRGRLYPRLPGKSMKSVL